MTLTEAIQKAETELLDPKGPTIVNIIAGDSVISTITSMCLVQARRAGDASLEISIPQETRVSNRQFYLKRDVIKAVTKALEELK